MRVVELSVYGDPERRAGADLLDAWPWLARGAAAVAASGVEVHVVHAAARDETIVRDGVEFAFVRERPPGPLARRAGLWAWPRTPRAIERVAALEPGVVHVHGLGFPRHLLALRARLPATPILVESHADPPPPRWRAGLHRRVLGGGPIGVAFTAAAQAEPFLAEAALPPGTLVLEMLESSSWFTPGDRDAARAAAGVSGDPCVALVGHLNEDKDPLTVLAAVERAAADLPEIRLVCCFRAAPLLDTVRDRIRGSDVLRDRVSLLGERDHDGVEALLRAADLLVSASRRESTGFTVLEALACGTPVVVSDIPSFRRITADGEAGGLVPAGDADALAAAIVQQARRDRPAARAAARAHFEAHLDLAAVARERRAAYDAVVRGAIDDGRA